MILIAQQGTGITGVTQIIGIVALHVDRPSPQIVGSDKLSHTPGYRAKLIIVTSCQFDSFLLSKSNKFLRLIGVECEGLFNVHASKIIMTFGWSRDVNNVGPGFLE